MVSSVSGTTPIPLARACNKPRARSGRSPRHRVGARPQSVLLLCGTRCMAGQFLGGDSTRHRRRAGEPPIAGRVSAAAVRHQGYLNHPRCSSQTRGDERGVLWRGSWTSFLTMQGDTTGVVESVCGRGEPDSAGCGARMRQPESPQEAPGVYTRTPGTVA
jgi:hypothetical protein